MIFAALLAAQAVSAVPAPIGHSCGDIAGEYRADDGSCRQGSIADGITPPIVGIQADTTGHLIYMPAAVDPHGMVRELLLDAQGRVICAPGRPVHLFRRRR